jgi:hypothetical protein
MTQRPRGVGGFREARYVSHAIKRLRAEMMVVIVTISRARSWPRPSCQLRRFSVEELDASALAGNDKGRHCDPRSRTPFRRVLVEDLELRNESEV